MKYLQTQPADDCTVRNWFCIMFKHKNMADIDFTIMTL